MQDAVEEPDGLQEVDDQVSAQYVVQVRVVLRVCRRRGLAQPTQQTRVIWRRARLEELRDVELINEPPSAVRRPDRKYVVGFVARQERIHVAKERGVVGITEDIPSGTRRSRDHVDDRPRDDRALPETGQHGLE